MDGRWLLAAARERCGRRLKERRVRAVLEVLLGETPLPQNRPDGPEVRLLGVVRGARDGQLLVREPEGIGGAGEDERDGLEGLRDRKSVV